MRFGPVLALCTGLLAAPVAQAAQPGSVARAVGQPFRDLSLIQDKLPDALKRAILLLVGHMYENREAVAVGVSTALLPMGVSEILSEYRNWTM